MEEIRKQEEGAKIGESLDNRIEWRKKNAGMAIISANNTEMHIHM
jgi:hypothetical protein